jgi:hypothetical protein
MNPGHQRRLQDAILCVCFSLPVPLIATMIRWNPSGAEPRSPFGSDASFLLFLVVNLAVMFAAFFFLLRIRGRTLFQVSYAVLFLVLLGYGTLLALRLHRDFYTFVFQHVLSFWIIFCWRLDEFTSEKRAKDFYRYMRTVNIVVFICTCCWLILMGYAVCVRSEPRWAESLFYNVLNLVFAFLLIMMTSHLGMALFKRVHIDGDRFVVEGYDFSQYVSDADKQLAVLFLSAHGTAVSCARVDALLQEHSAPHAGRKSTWDCAACIERDYAVYKCPKYRAIYNRVLTVKRLFEALEIGDILSPKGQASEKKKGWKLRLFDDVRLVGR